MLNGLGARWMMWMEPSPPSLAQVSEATPEIVPEVLQHISAARPADPTPCASLGADGAPTPRACPVWDLSGLECDDKHRRQARYEAHTEAGVQRHVRELDQRFAEFVSASSTASCP